MSFRKRSLSSFSPVSLSQKRQGGGEYPPQKKGPPPPPPPRLYLEVDEDYATLVEERREDFVDLEAELLAEFQVLVGDPELPEVVPVQQGVSEFIVLVAKLYYRGFELPPFLEAEQPGEGTRGDVADHYLDRQHVELPGLYGRVVDLLDEVGGDAVRLEVGEDRRAHGGVGLALVLPRTALLCIERRRFVLVAM